MRGLPQYRVHKTKNLGYVTIDGEQIYLGRAHSPESMREYHARIAEHLAEKPPQKRSTATAAQSAFTIGELSERYYHAMRAQHGQQSRTTYEALYTAQALTKSHATCSVVEFGPLAFKTIRDRVAKSGRTRQGVNRLMSRIRRCFKWGVSEELVPAERLLALQSVDGLRYGSAPENPRREAADPKAVSVCIDWLESQSNHGAANILRFIGATGCRPSEAAALKWSEIKLDHKYPHYLPARHKTACHGITRQIALNSDAVAVLRDCMKLGQVDGLVFTHTRGRGFTSNSILLAVRRAVAATGCPNWCTYGLRHLAATTALNRTGSEAAAAAMLGHAANSKIIQTYTQNRLALASQAANSLVNSSVAV